MEPADSQPVPAPITQRARLRRALVVRVVYGADSVSGVVSDPQSMWQRPFASQAELLQLIAAWLEHAPPEPQ